jgi:TatD DNase family protein
MLEVRGFPGLRRHRDLSASEQHAALAARHPLENIVVETDTPGIPPSFHGTLGSRARNSPEYLPRIGAMLAEVRGMSVAAFAEATAGNVRQVLGKL